MPAARAPKSTSAAAVSRSPALPAAVPDDTHEWVSFDDPDERRTWIFDVTFLTSGWTCIYGRGCQGVLTEPAPEYEQGCCSYGAHFVDDEDVAQVTAAVARLPEHLWQFAKKAGGKRGWLKPDRAGEGGTTRVVDGACIFLNRPGWASGAGCALHQAALAVKERPLDWKPDVCWQLPLRRDERILEDGSITTTIHEWRRRDWGKGGEEFAWWCTEAPSAFVDRKPVWQTLRAEITEMCGGKVYERLAAYMSSRPRRAFLPHPTVRRR